MSTVLAPVRRILNAACRFAPVRVPTLAGIETLCRAAARVLRGSPWVTAVYVRGSYVRGGFRPFLSDVDLAVVVRRPPPGRGYEVAQGLNRRLRVAGIVNPFVRDVWQTFLPQAQWGLASRFGDLLGLDEWRLLAGEPPWDRPRAVDDRLLLAAWWNRQHFWTDFAQRQALKGRGSAAAVARGLQKARGFATKLSERLEGRAGGLPRAPGTVEEPLSLAGALVELARSAERLMEGLDLPRAGGGAGAGTERDPTPREREALAALREALGSACRPEALISTEGWLAVVGEAAASPQRATAFLEAARRVHRATGIATLAYSPAAFALAPLRRELRLLARGEPPRVSPAVEPLLWREQLLYEALFAATHLWVAPGRPDPARSLALHLANALELCGFFLAGRWRRTPSGWREALAGLVAADARLRRMVEERPDLQPLVSGASQPAARELFELGSVVSERLAELLIASVEAPAAFVAASR